jgi:hypothetical protein
MPADPEILELLKTTHPFRLLKPEALELLAEEVDVMLFKDGEEIYKFSQDAENFYLILNGKVHLTQYVHEEGELFGEYERGDMIGYEALLASQRFNMDAVAVDEVHLLSFDDQLMELLFKDEPQLANSLQRMYDSYQLSRRVPIHWLDDDEGIYFVTIHHRLFILLRILPPIILGLLVTGLLAWFAVAQRSSLFTVLGIVSFLLFGIWFLWVWVDENNDYSIITNKRVISTQKVLFLYESRQEIPLQAVLSNTIDTSYWGRLFGYGDVRVRTYTGTLVFRRLATPTDVISMLEEQRARATQQVSHQERQNMIRFMQRRLKLLPPEEAKNPENGVPTEVRQGSLSNFLNRLFQMRVLIDDQIIYRTHWFILLKKTILPFLLASAAFLAILLSLLGVIPMVGGLLSLLLLALAWLASIGWWVYQYLDWSNDKYIITNDQIMDINKKPLGQEEKRTASLDSIQEIEYKRLGILGLVLNFGTVYILIGTEKFTFDEVYNPSQVQHELFERMNAKKQRNKLESELHERERIADMLEIYHTVTEAERKGKI